MHTKHLLKTLEVEVPDSRLKMLKGTVMQIEKALINDHLRVSKVF